MPYRLIEDEQESSQESWPAYIGRNIVRTGANILATPGNIQQTVKSIYKNAGVPGPLIPPILQVPLPTTETFASRLPEKYLEPKNIGEDILSTTIENLPLTYLTGGSSFAARLAKDVFGTAAMRGIKSLGGGPLAQIAGGVGAGFGFGKLHELATKSGNSKSLANLAKTAQQQFYNKEIELGSKISAKVPTLNSKLSKLYDQVQGSKALTVANKNELGEKIKLLVGDVTDNTINASKLVESNKEINKLFNHFRGPKEIAAREYLDRIQKTILEAGEEIGKNNPEWYEAWQAGNAVTKAIHYKPKLESLRKYKPGLKVKNSLANAALGAGTGIGGYLGGIPGAIGGGIAGVLAGQAGKSLGNVATKIGSNIGNKAIELYGFMGDTRTQKILADVFKHTIKDEIPALATSLNKLDKYADHYEKKIGKSNKYRLIED